MIGGQICTPAGRRARFRVDAFAWSRPEPAERAVDGSIRLWLSLSRRRQRALWMNLRLTRASERAFLCPLSTEQIGALAEGVLDRQDLERYPIDCISDWYYHLRTPPPDTVASRYGHPARQRLDEMLSLGSQPWMQDWPLEVARPEQIDRYIEVYETAEDDDLRHDAMWLVLEAVHAGTPAQGPIPRWDWLASRIPERFPLHAHAAFQLGAWPSSLFRASMQALCLRCLVPVALVPIEEAR